MKRIWLEYLPGVILALGAGVIYWITLSMGPYPGEPARMLAQAANLNEPATTLNPLWRMAMELIAEVAPQKLAFLANLFSALCAVLAVGILFHLVAGTLVELVEFEDQTQPRVRVAAVCGGVAASLSLAFSIPFWFAATRSTPAAWHMLGLIAFAFAFLKLYRRPTAWLLVVISLAAGVGVVEFTSFILFLPLFLIFGLVILWQNEMFTWRMLALAVFGFIVGLLFYVVVAWHFTGTTTYVVDGFSGIPRVIYGTWLAQYALLIGSLPQLHWLILVLATAIPWIIILITARRGLNGATDPGSIILHVVLTATALAVIFNTRLAPWSIFGTKLFYVTPYVLVATYYGYIVAYWMLVPWHAWGLDEGWRLRSVPFISGAVVVILLVPLGIAAFRNLPEADGRPSYLIDRFCRTVLEDLGGRKWLVSDGVLDDNLLIAARQMNRRVNVLNINLGNKDNYMRRVALQFDDPRLKSLAQVGLVPLLQEWLRDDPAAIDSTGILNIPDLWYAAGISPLPYRTIFIGQTTNASETATTLMTRHTDAWHEWGPLLGTNTATADTSAEMVRNYLRRHFSMVANNLGVVMEDWKRRDDAWRAYAAARTLSPGNLSALLNQYVMVRGGYPAINKEEVVTATERLVNDKTPRPNIWRLTRAYGYVRMSEAFADLGVNWALSGQPGMAVASLRRAISLNTTGNDRYKRTLATVYASQDLKQESAALLEELIKHRPDDQQALITLARVRARQNDLLGAEQLLKRAEATKMPRDALALEWAAIYYLGGGRDRARITLQELVELNPENTRAWSFLAMVLLEHNDEHALEECYQALMHARKLDFSGLVARGQIALRRRKVDDARNDFEQALVLNPNNAGMLEQLLQLDVRMGRPDLAEQHMKRLIAIDPDNAIGNYFMGSLQVRGEQYALAENSFRKSLQGMRSPTTLNDLAWVLYLQEKYTEAESLVREALKLNQRFAAAHDTLGMIMLGAGKVTEAEASLRKAISINGEDVVYQIHLAEVLVRRKAWSKARSVIQPLMSRTSEITRRDRERLYQLRQEAEHGGS